MCHNFFLLWLLSVVHILQASLQFKPAGDAFAWSYFSLSREGVIRVKHSLLTTVTKNFHVCFIPLFIFYHGSTVNTFGHFLILFEHGHLLFHSSI